MAVLVACDIEYYTRYAGAFVRSVQRNTKQEDVYVCVNTRNQEPWEHASARFYYAQKINEPELVILDADSLCVKDFTLPAGDVGLYLRPQNPPGMQVAAGMVVVRDRGFLDALCENLKKESGWFADQKALWKTYRSYKADYFDVSHVMTWDFDERPVWSAKGALKRQEAFKAEMRKYVS